MPGRGRHHAALATVDPEDTWQQHAADTLQESYLLADPRTVQIVTEGAARGIEDLERYGARFAREEDGRISQRFFGAHTFRRTAFAGDYTGLEIQRALVNRAAQLQVPILDTAYVSKFASVRPCPRIRYLRVPFADPSMYTPSKLHAGPEHWETEARAGEKRPQS